MEIAAQQPAAAASTSPSRPAPTCPGRPRSSCPGGATFRDLTRLSAAGIPTITLVFGSSTAGGAYVPGHERLHRAAVQDAATVFLGGPPLVKMAIDEDADEEALGGAEMHARISGLADYLAADERDAHPHRPRDRRATCDWRKLGPGPTRRRPTRRCYDAEELLGIASADVRVPFDVREVIARIVDGSRFEEFKPLYGTHAGRAAGRDLHGYPVGILANNGILFSEESQKGAQFIQLCNRTRHADRCSCRTSPASWSARATSRAASSRTARS